MCVPVCKRYWQEWAQKECQLRVPYGLTNVMSFKSRQKKKVNTML